MALEIHCVHREKPEEFCGDFISSSALAWTYAYTMCTTDTELTNSKGFLLSPHQTHTLTSTTYLIQLYMRHIHVHNTNMHRFTTQIHGKTDPQRARTHVLRRLLFLVVKRIWYYMDPLNSGVLSN